MTPQNLRFRCQHCQIAPFQHLRGLEAHIQLDHPLLLSLAWLEAQPAPAEFRGGKKRKVQP